jgi:hypothetical protein
MLGNSYRDLRLFVWMMLKPQKGSGASQRTVEKRRGTLPRVGQVWEMRDYRLVAAVGTLTQVLCVGYTLVWLEKPSLVEFLASSQG